MKKNLILLLSAIVATLLAAELVLRLLGLGGYSPKPLAEHPFHRYDPVTGWSLVPNQAKLPINDQGIRATKEYVEAQHQGVTRIALCGDSVIFGLNAPYRNTISARMEQPGIEAINFGVPGYGTDQALIRYRTVARRFHPDYVCIGVSLLNDAGNNCYPQQYGASKPAFRLVDGKCILENKPSGRRRHELETGLRRASRLYNLARAAYINWETNRQMDRFCRDEDDPRLREALRLTTALLETFVNEVRADGTVPIVVILPYRVQYLAQDPHPLYLATLELCAEKDVPFVDGVKLIGKDRIWDKQAFLDGSHFSGLGAGIIAGAILEKIVTFETRLPRQNLPGPEWKGDRG